MRGADRAIYLLDELAKRNPSADIGATVEYFRANAWSVKETAAGKRSWAWEQAEREQQILALSRSVVHAGFVKLDPMRRCQILTNRAIQLNAIGRFIDAIEGWNAALRIIPTFAMAQANRGLALRYYAGFFESDRERAILLLHAYEGLIAATSENAIFDSEKREELISEFSKEAKTYAKAADIERIRELRNSEIFSLGKSKAERQYRQWCLDQCLFLNPLNELGSDGNAASDNLVLPPISEALDDRPTSATPPPIFGFFNQMKQEYVSARFTLYEGLCDTTLHFSDRNVSMFDTLDYPMHSLATERIRTAYRIAYSLLDKVAFVVNHYWKLGKIESRVSFKNVWMVEGKPRLLDQFKDYGNWPLRGLFWLSKELFDDQLKHTTGPDARELHEIRNALEHKFLQVHEGWARPFRWSAPSGDGLALSIDSDLLEAKTIRVMKIARSALFQLALAIGVEERKRDSMRSEKFAGTMPLFDLDDRRKRRDPV